MYLCNKWKQREAVKTQAELFRETCQRSIVPELESKAVELFTSMMLMFLTLFG